MGTKETDILLNKMGKLLNGHQMIDGYVALCLFHKLVEKKLKDTDSKGLKELDKIINKGIPKFLKQMEEAEK